MELSFYVPSFRKTKRGRPQGMDGLNEIIRDARCNRYAAAARKHRIEAYVSRIAAEAADASGWERPTGRCTVALEFREPDARRDDDNVFAFAKYVLDAMCVPTESGRGTVHAEGAGIIEDDDPAHVRLVCTRGRIDRDNPGIQVTITEETNEEEWHGIRLHVPEEPARAESGLPE